MATPRRRLMIAATVLSSALALAAVARIAPRGRQGRPWTMSPAEFAAQCRGRFAREHPGQKPLSRRIGDAAVRFHRTRPMGRFRLSLKVGEWGNDCSDFVECVVDEGLGVKARFRRGSDQHLVGAAAAHFADVAWDRHSPLQPGDVVSVAHSPWYDPYPGANWHVGVVGSDGMVYDFVKLKRWKAARYGRTTPQWFARHSPARPQTIVMRLRPEYDYLLRPVRRGEGHY